MQTRSYHEPVLVREVLAGLSVRAGKRYIDATLGGGGHAKEIAALGGIVLGIDTDAEAIEENKERKIGTVQGNFKDIETLAGQKGFGSVDGILFDLGVSSHQLDTKERGFSYRFSDAPIDLRLNQAQKKSAIDYLRYASEEELYEIIATFGEEERARAISIAIVRARAVKPILSMADLIGIMGSEYASLSRTLQALRIAVNDELTVLKMGLEGAKHLLVPGGRLAVISFHSLEDRLVKRSMKQDGWLALTKKPVVPGVEEITKNRRARSAKLRIAQKI